MPSPNAKYSPEVRDVHARLLARAKAHGESYDQALQYFAIERFLYRLSLTEWGERLVVKGAIMLRAWGTPLGRPTRGIDFLGEIDNSAAAVEQAVRDCLAVEYPDDGLVFDADQCTADSGLSAHDRRCREVRDDREQGTREQSAQGLLRRLVPRYPPYSRRGSARRRDSCDVRASRHGNPDRRTSRADGRIPRKRRVADNVESIPIEQRD